MPTKSVTSKSYYQKNNKYREELIRKETAEHKRNKAKYAKKAKDYYHSNSEYREYKKAYAKKYRKLEPVKSRARKDRKALKEK